MEPIQNILDEAKQDLNQSGPENQKTSVTVSDLSRSKFEIAYRAFARQLKARVLQEGSTGYIISDPQINLPLQAFVAWASCNDELLKSIDPSLSANKGMLLAGNVGSGKSLLFRVHKDLIQLDATRSIFRPLVFTSCEQLAEKYESAGPKELDRYGKDSAKPDMYRPGCFILTHACFDDLGNEEAKKNFGNKKEVMKDLISIRYDYYLEHRLTSSFTTNLSFEQITARYDTRIESRLKQMCNVITIGGTTNYVDRRKCSSPNHINSIKQNNRCDACGSVSQPELNL